MAHTHVLKSQSGFPLVPAGSDLSVDTEYRAAGWATLGRDGSFVRVSDRSTLENPGFGSAPTQAFLAGTAALQHNDDTFDHIYLGSDYGLLERQRPDIALLARFARSVEFATFHMCVAFDIAGIADFDMSLKSHPQRKQASWFGALADATFDRFKILRRALAFDWTPPVEVEPLTCSAFYALCDLTPASSHSLKQLYFSRRGHAYQSLVQQLDVTASMIEAALQLRRDAEAAINNREQEDDANRLAGTQDEILSKAGDALSLRQAAERLGMTHQNLHKRIGNNSALGVMRGRQLVVPSVQFVEDKDGEKILPELRQVLRLFADSGAGMWSALQYLTEHDPVLGATPMDILKAGGVAASTAAARSYLGLDET